MTRMDPITVAADAGRDSSRSNAVTGLILAGGAGQRMQGRDKGLVEWRGRPLVAHAAATLRPLVGQLIISCNRHIEDYSALSDSIVTDLRTGHQGPLAGLEAAQEVIEAAELLVAPCDMTGLDAGVYTVLLHALRDDASGGRDAVFLHSGGRDFFLCMALRRKALTTLTAYLDGGDRSVRGWLATLSAVAVPMTLQSRALHNVNTIATAG